jgi:hypothetical protein
MITYPYIILKRFLQEISQIKEVDFYREQDKDTNEGVLKIAPAAYLRFMPVDTESLGRGIQAGKMSFEVILLSDCLYDDDKRIYRTTGPMSHLAIVDLIHKKFSGVWGMLSNVPGMEALAGTDEDYQIFGALDRVNIDTDDTQKAIMKTTQTFECRVIDYSAYQEFVNATADLIIENLVIYKPEA